MYLTYSGVNGLSEALMPCPYTENTVIGSLFNTLFWRIHTIGLKAIIEGSERDLAILKRLLKHEEQNAKPVN
jgi:hypothetical protein